MTEAAELIARKDLVAHVCSVAIGFGATARKDLMIEYQAARQELSDHIETLEARVATLSAALEVSRRTHISIVENYEKSTTEHGMAKAAIELIDAAREATR